MDTAPRSWSTIRVPLKSSIVGIAWIPKRDVGTDRSGIGLGLALGAVYVPCAGPVLAAITVAGSTGRIGPETLVLTLSFAIGTALPLPQQRDVHRVHVGIEHRLQQSVVRAQRLERRQMPVALGEILIQPLQLVGRKRFLGRQKNSERPRPPAEIGFAQKNRNRNREHQSDHHRAQPSKKHRRENKR